jgi:hypothetical protein
MKQTLSLLDTTLIKNVKIQACKDGINLSISYYDESRDLSYEGSLHLKGDRDRVKEAYLKIMIAILDGKQFVEIDL